MNIYKRGLKRKEMERHQLSFLDLLEASDKDYDLIIAKKDDRYCLQFSERIAMEIIRDAISVITSPSSTTSECLDEIAWLFSSEHQEDSCSFTNCCLNADLDPEVIHHRVLRLWKKKLNCPENLPPFAKKRFEVLRERIRKYIKAYSRFYCLNFNSISMAF